jgi:Flp pilus assembly pilin Flp
MRMQRIKNFINDESGMETLEYALIAALIAIAAGVVYGTGWYNVLANTLINASN